MKGSAALDLLAADALAIVEYVMATASDDELAALLATIEAAADGS